MHKYGITTKVTCYHLNKHICLFKGLKDNFRFTEFYRFTNGKLNSGIPKSKDMSHIRSWNRSHLAPKYFFQYYWSRKVLGDAKLHAKYSLIRIFFRT